MKNFVGETAWISIILLGFGLSTGLIKISIFSIIFFIFLWVVGFLSFLYWFTEVRDRDRDNKKTP
jgi:hypothetical protein